MSLYTEFSDDNRINDAVSFLKLVSEADSNNRREALEDLKFAGGDQWPVELQNSRNLEARPCLTINKTDAYCRQVTNQQRQQRPRIRVHPVNNQADAKMAQIIEGITRHVEVNSNADQAYDHAFDMAVRMGWGYWRVMTQYTREDSFDMDIFIKMVENPFTVYWDPNSVEWDGSDAEQCLITSVLSKEKFRKMYPDADDGSGFTPRGTGDAQAEWVMKEDIRVAEWMHVERVKDKLLLLSDGQTIYESDFKRLQDFTRGQLIVVGDRSSFRRKVKWEKLTCMQVLEERTLDGRYIPVVPVYGIQQIVEDKRRKFGLVRFAKDPQRMYNFWRTSMTESVALAPKAKWLLAEGQDEGHEYEWAQANIKSTAVLHYKQTDIEGKPAPQPTRLQPEPPPLGIMQSAAAIEEDLRSVVGIYDANQMNLGNVSGKALMGQQMQIDNANFHFYDNLTKSIKHTGRIILDLIPYVYSNARVMRIIGADGTPELISLNERKQDEMGVTQILNDVTVGEYDVVMETGPGYQSKRMQAVDAMVPIMQANPELFKIAGDLVFKNMDFPGADVIADRLASMNPMAQLDPKSDVPPRVQMQLAQADAQMKQMGQVIEQLQMQMKQRMDIEGVRQEAETTRKLMDVTARAHNVETMAEVKVNDQNTRSITSQNKTEIEAIVELMLHNMDTARLEREIARRNAEQYGYMMEAAQDIHHQSNPLTSQ